MYDSTPYYTVYDSTLSMFPEPCVPTFLSNLIHKPYKKLSVWSRVTLKGGICVLYVVLQCCSRFRFSLAQPEPSHRAMGTPDSLFILNKYINIDVLTEVHYPSRTKTSLAIL